jgi:hypothetical protein
MEKKQGKADLHIHTTYSYDGVSTVQEVIDFAEYNTDLDIIAITDHNKILGGLEACKLACDYRISVVTGEEILTREGELLALFIQEKIKPFRKVTHTIKEIHAQGGLAIAPHPFSWVNPSIPLKTLYKISNGVSADCRLDAIEIFNASLSGKTGYKRRRRLNSKVFTLPEVASSDGHCAEDIGSAYTAFCGTTPEDLYKSIKSGLTTSYGVFLPVGDFFKVCRLNFKKYGKKAVKPYKALKKLREFTLGNK